MKKLFMFIALLSFVNQYELFAQTLYLNGIEWPGFAYSCPGSNISLTVTITGSNAPDSCIWQDENLNQLSTSFTYSAAPGVYYFTTIDNGAQQDYYLIVANEDTLKVNPTVSNYGGVNISTYGGNDGYITLEVLGGHVPYTYDWPNFVTTKNDSNLTAGTYSVTVTDVIGCTATASETLTQPAQPLTLDTIITSNYFGGYQISRNGENDGKIKLHAVGGTAPYKYFVDGKALRSDSAIELNSKYYEVFVTDAAHDTVYSSKTLTQPADLSLSLTASTYTVNGQTYNVGCYNCTNGSITPTITGGVTPYRYSWNTGQTTSSISGLSSGYYVLTVIDTTNKSVKAPIFLTAPEKDVWGLAGNSNTDSTIQFLGTTDSKPVIIKTNNIERIHIENGGEVIFKSPIEVDEITLIKPLKLDTLKVGRILPLDGDTVVKVGSGSINFYDKANVIYATPTTSTITWGGFTGILKGISMGFGSIAPGTHALALNYWSRADGDYSLAMGAYTKASANNSIVIGSGPSFGDYLENTITSAIFIGSHSRIPSIVVLPGTATSAGKVGIGTTSPASKLHVVVDANDTYGGIFLDRNSSSTQHSEIQFLQQGNEKWAIGTDFSGIGNSDDFFIWNHSRQKAAITITNAICNGCSGPTYADVAVGIDFNPADIGSQRNGNYKLYVGGNIACRELKVTAQNFPDYVFKEDYQLMSLNNLKSYIDSAGHLPGIPSTLEVITSEGYEVGKLQLELLKKIEEQTLYIFELQTRIEVLERKIKN